MKHTASSFAVAASFVFFVYSAKAQPTQSIVEIATSDPQFSTLVTALDAAGLVETLQGEGPFTVFAPTNDAFAALPAGTLDSLLLPENVDQLTNILLYHVVPGRLMASDVVSRSKAKTATTTQQLVSFSVDNGQAKIDNANIVVTDIEATNGVIHVIDAVILPEELDNIVNTAVAAGSFTTLASALEAAGLVDTLANDGPFTVFAPTDEAFAALPEGTVESLLNDIPTLTNILLFHVVEGKVTSDEVINLTSATTLNGSDVSISVVDGNVLVQDSTVTAVDIDTTNGIIHVINQVLLPESNVKSWELFN